MRPTSGLLTTSLSLVSFTALSHSSRDRQKRTVELPCQRVEVCTEEVSWLMVCRLGVAVGMGDAR